MVQYAYQLTAERKKHFISIIFNYLFIWFIVLVGKSKQNFYLNCRVIAYNIHLHTPKISYDQPWIK